MDWIDDDFTRILNEQNPWKLSGIVPASLVRPVRRPFAEHLWNLVHRPALDRYHLVIGPRRVGKTVAMYQTVAELLRQKVDAKKLWWLHLAHPLLMRMDLGHLVDAAIRFSRPTEKQPLYLFLDELTYARDWDTWLKSFYDERRPIRLIGTSSATAALRQRRIESGVGRWEEQYLSPCLFSEYLKLQGRALGVEVAPTLFETIHNAIDRPDSSTPDLTRDRHRYMLVGGFPELLMQQTMRQPDPPSLFGDSEPDLASDLFLSQRVLRSDAVQKAVYIDIPQVFGVGDPINLERLLYTLAGQITGILSFNTIATDVGLSVKTVEKYTSYFERSYLLFMLPNYAPREESIQRRGRKLFFVDGSIRNAALQRGITPLTNPQELGLLVENMVAAHLHALAQQSDARLFYWRDGKQEIDFVYDHPEGPMAFEVSSSPGHSTAGLQAFEARYPKFRGRCYLVSPEPEAITPDASRNGIGRVPLNLFLIVVGIQAEEAMRRRMAVP